MMTIGPLAAHSGAAAPPPSPGAGPAPAVTVETLFLDGGDPSLAIHVRNKRPVGVERFDENRVVVMVHGATYPAETGFDLDLPGGSWMDVIAQRGFDVYALDVRGYGRSTRPPAMSEPPSRHRPFADTAEAIADVAAVVEFVRRRRSVQRVNLIGWSWGTALMAGFTQQANEKVARLVLYAPLWLFDAPVTIPFEGAWRAVDRNTARSRNVAGIPAGRVEEISPRAWFDKWWAANLLTDPQGAARKPPVLRAPNGVMQDLRDHWAAGKPTWDPAAIRVPVLLLVGEWDRDTPPYMAREIDARLVNAPVHRLKVLAEGTHAMVLERHRMRLIDAAQAFLEEAF